MENVETTKQRFAQVFPGAGEPMVCRAPGRINLIGEHVDYNGLPVLPMAIEREIRVAFASRPDGIVRMLNHAAAFPEAVFANQADIPPSPPGSWDNYCKAAIQGLNRRFKTAKHPGMSMYIEGGIPVAAGLSSSSALVVACSLAYLAVLGKGLERDITRLELATLLADAEHYVGTRGGGMDQAIILLGRENAACKIDFFPLRVENVPLFPGHEFIACHSLVEAAKTGDALHAYNEGPLTCRLIRALVEKQAQEEFGEVVTIDRIGDLWYGPLCLTNGEVAGLFGKAFATETMTLNEIAARLGMSHREVREKWLGDLKEPEHGFRLRARARHQLTEFARVEAARDMLLAGDAAGFGELMDESHESCAADNRVSCPELDELVRIARRSGAVGLG